MDPALPPPHGGLPPTTGWLSPTLPLTYRAITQLPWSSQEVILQGLSTDLARPDITVASLNVNGLTEAKLTELLWYLNHASIDVFILLDTRCGERTSKFLSKQAREILSPGSPTASLALRSPAHPRNPTDTATFQSMVGG